jgi:glucans biosynthesis protein
LFETDMKLKENGKNMQRRELLKIMAAFTAAGLPLPAVSAAASRLRVVPGKSQSFDYASLKGRARAMAQTQHVASTEKIPAAVERLDWDQYQAIRYRDDHALWAGEGRRFQAKFFHLGLFFRTPVHIYTVVDGRAEEVAYDAAMFDYGKSGLQNEHFAEDLGFAGFRLLFHPDWTRDVAVFLGASYFRAVGGEKQYGLSARGLAVTASSTTARRATTSAPRAVVLRTAESLRSARRRAPVRARPRRPLPGSLTRTEIRRTRR